MTALHTLKGLTMKYYGGAYLLDENGTWRYADDGALVPGATRLMADDGTQLCVAPEFLSQLMLDTNAVADFLGVDPRTVSTLLSRGDLPEPQVRLGRSPLWTRPVIEKWHKKRPGKGANFRNRSDAA